MRIPKCMPDHWNNPRHREYFGLLYLGTPKWLSREQIKQYHAVMRRARIMRKSGRDVHVDHIVPVVSKFVCGLNVPWNLQIIEAGPNMSKGNTTWPGCPWENRDLFGHDDQPQQLKLF